MSEGKKRTSTQYRNQYTADNYDRLNVFVPKGRKADIAARAKAIGETINGYTNSLYIADLGLQKDDWKQVARDDE